ncbi:hypothetical protein QBC39DRAFT_341781 [Podospora conica]|nr:hypothetical protein QBC39DRAFT_341781 [Schizothecium conicum]
MKISAYSLLTLVHLAMVLVLTHLAMVVAGTDAVSTSSSSNKSVTTSASSNNKKDKKDKKDMGKKDNKKDNQDPTKKRGLCCNASCRECTRVPCNDYHECMIFYATQFGTCCRSPPVKPTDFSRNVMWGFIGTDCYVLRKRVLNQV